MKKMLAVLLLATACATKPPDYGPAIQQLEAAVAQQPEHATYVYLLAMYNEQAGNIPESLRWLQRLDELGWNRGIEPREFPKWNDAHELVDSKMERVANATVAYTIPQRDLIPEGIAYDPAGDALYIGSIHRRKVIRVDRNGNVTDFVAEGRDGMLGALGMKVDPQRRHLWVASYASEEMRGFTKADEGRAALFVFDLRDGTLVRKWTSGGDGVKSLLNDMVVLGDGSALVTDSERRAVYKTEGDQLVEWAKDFLYPNGIARDGDWLYVADFRGLTRFDLRDKARHTLAGHILGGIDGLTVHEGSLVAIQNAPARGRAIRVHLDDARAAVTRIEVLEAKNPHFDFPTTGVIARGEYYFLANPQLRAFDEKTKKIWPMRRLKDVVVLKLEL